MLEYDFLRSINDYVKIYRNYPLPVILCKRDMQVYWSNNLAKSLYPQFVDTEDLATALLEFPVNDLLDRVETEGCCVITEIIPLTSTQLVMTPVTDGSEMIGVVLTVLNVESIPGPRSLYVASRAAEVLNSCIRGSIQSVFSEMDRLAMKADFEESSWIKANLSRIGTDSYRILRVTGNLTEYAKFQCGVTDLRLDILDLAYGLGAMKDSLAAIGKEIGIPVELQLPDSPCMVYGDSKRLELAVINILHNSLYYTRPGNSVRVTLEKQENTALLTVRDQGRGIPAEVMESIWRPYYSSLAEGGGIGMGLPLTRAIVTAHKGHIELHSVPGQGTTVTITLPASGLPGVISLGMPGEEIDRKDRFSPICTGLADAVSSPFRSQSQTT